MEQRTDYKHAISLLMVNSINRYEHGNITKEQLLAILDSVEDVPVDESQAKFFVAIRQLIDKVEGAIKGFALDEKEN